MLEFRLGRPDSSELVKPVVHLELDKSQRREVGRAEAGDLIGLLLVHNRDEIPVGTTVRFVGPWSTQSQ